MADFTTAQQYVKVAEGGYSTDVNDAGNYNNFDKSTTFVGTNFGISAPTLSAYLGRPATAADMQALTYDTALAIYKKNYWDAVNGDSIQNQSIALMCYDSAVNQGVGAISSMVSDTLGIPVSIPFSQNVVSAINNYPDQQDLFNKLSQARIDRYSSEGFGSAFINRVQGIIFDATQAVTDKVKKNPLLTIAIITTLVAITFGIIYRKKITKLFNKI